MEQELNKAQSKYIKPSRQQKQEIERQRNSGSLNIICDGTLMKMEGNNVEKLVCKQSNMGYEDSEGKTVHRSILETIHGPESGNELYPEQVCGKIDLEALSTVRRISKEHLSKEISKNFSDQQEQASVDTSTNAYSLNADANEILGTPHHKKLTVHVNRTQFRDQDLLVPWQLKVKSADKTQAEGSEETTKGDLFHRFYHVFRQGELEAMCKRISGCMVTKSYYDQGNWCILLEKL